MTARDDALTGAFRDRVRAWLSASVPGDWRERMQGADEDAYVAFQRGWFRTLRDGGFAAPHWPEAHGGGGLSLSEQVVLFEEMARHDAPGAELYFVSINHAYATIQQFGSTEQRARHLPAILDGEVWCQGFSEPEAGSDLASLRTRATRDGDHFVVNGQKVWSSFAGWADRCLLLARTDPDAPRKHQGLSYFLLDMSSAGVETRPIRQSTGHAEFYEIFLDDVRIPATDLVGEEGQGWRIAQATLSSERGTTMLELVERLRAALPGVTEMARATVGPGERPWVEDAELRRALARVEARTNALRGLVDRAMRAVEERGHLGPEATALKILYSEVLTEVTRLAATMTGPQALLRAPLVPGSGDLSGDWANDVVNTWKWSIGGGTNEVLRNVIGEHVLGLPREPATA